MRCVALVLVVLSGYLLLDFPNVYHAKTSSFGSFSDKNFATDPKIAQSQNTKSMVFATLSPKCYQKTRTKNMGKTKTPKRRLVHENLAKHRVFLFFPKIPPKHKRRTPRGGRRTCYLVVVVVALPAQAAAHCSRRITTRQPVEGPIFNRSRALQPRISVAQAAHGTVLTASVRQPPVKLSS